MNLEELLDVKVIMADWEAWRLISHRALVKYLEQEGWKNAHEGYRGLSRVWIGKCKVDDHNIREDRYRCHDKKHSCVIPNEENYDRDDVPRYVGDAIAAIAAVSGKSQMRVYYEMLLMNDTEEKCP